MLQSSTRFLMFIIECLGVYKCCLEILKSGVTRCHVFSHRDAVINTVVIH